jgi:hypothetical protein
MGAQNGGNSAQNGGFFKTNLVQNRDAWLSVKSV